MSEQERKSKHIAHLLGAGAAAIFAAAAGYACLMSSAKASRAGVALFGALAVFGVLYAVVFVWQASRAGQSGGRR